jgi:putative mRNA 3-end processing factor
MLVLTPQGLFCEAGNFYIDPKGRVENALVTHAHSDHARRGASRYITAQSGLSLLRSRLGNVQAKGVKYGEPFQMGPVKVSLHPAGHILGSAQVRMEFGGEVWLASGDYKREPDPSCEPFEVVKADVFVTEATFGTKAYHWDRKKNLGDEIREWWRTNERDGINSLIFAYSLGKTQRILAELAGEREIFLAPAATPLVECYRNEGVRLAPTRCLSTVRAPLRGELILAPQSLLQTPLAKRLGDFRTAFASGWMATGTEGYDHGFVMSDHADWDDLVRTVLETGAKRVYVQHRGKGALVRHLRSLGLEAFPEADLAKPMTQHAQMRLF